MRPPWAIAVLAAAALLLAAAFHLTGWLQPALFPDSYGYLRAAGSAEPWSLDRHPLYGWLALSLEKLGPGHALVPSVQYGMQVAAAFALHAAGRRAGLSQVRWIAAGSGRSGGRLNRSADSAPSARRRAARAGCCGWRAWRAQVRQSRGP